MNRNRDIIQVFEYEHLSLGEKFKERHLKALSDLNALHNDTYFDIRYKGVRFRNFVGVVQIDGLTIEILPKIDAHERDKELWQQVLIQMLQATKKLKVQKVGQANVAKQNIHLLDIYLSGFYRK